MLPVGLYSECILHCLLIRIGYPGFVIVLRVLIAYASSFIYRYVSAKPQRLYCPTCDETYDLPQNGKIVLYKELKCPLDKFEVSSQLTQLTHTVYTRRFLKNRFSVFSHLSSLHSPLTLSFNCIRLTMVVTAAGDVYDREGGTSLSSMPLLLQLPSV